MQKLLTPTLVLIGFLTLIVFNPPASAQPGKVENKDRERAQIMLRVIKDKLKNHYYDPTFRGMDLDARFQTASEKVKEAVSIGQIFGIIAQVLVELEDSHTIFIPPSRAFETEYGWTMHIIGDRCYVSSVDKGSDAEAKGVKPGDEVVEAGGYKIIRENLWKVDYLYRVLRPQPSMRVILRSPGGEERKLELLAKQKQTKRVVDLTDYGEYMNLVRRAEREAEIGRDPFKSFGDQLLIWKMNEFDLTDAQIDDAMARAKKHKALILDLRGNGGGWVTTIMRLVGNLFDRDIKIGDAKSRKETKAEIAKSRGDKVFKGKLTILVDSRSASASEVLARTVQLEKRGTIIGDRTAGKVMTSIQFVEQAGIDVVVFYGVGITISDLIMTDGNSLENRGVTPDEVRLPTSEDLAAGRDVVMSYAASREGVTLDPVEAGKLFPLMPKKLKSQ